tara:strand:- start:537 stop:974 length:438 start_codon:yes stop_codon:yes gene_type:complete
MNKIEIQNEVCDKITFREDDIINVSNSVLVDFSKQNSTINIIISDDEFLRKLKKDFFDVDAYTDVISFNLEDEGKNIDGEIYISWDRINDNANKYKQTVNSELKRIIIHGILHLLGYDDQTKQEKLMMTELENKYLIINSGVLVV